MEKITLKDGRVIKKSDIVSMDPDKGFVELKNGNKIKLDSAYFKRIKEKRNADLKSVDNMIPEEVKVEEPVKQTATQDPATKTTQDTTIKATPDPKVEQTTATEPKIEQATTEKPIDTKETKTKPTVNTKTLDELNAGKLKYKVTQNGFNRTYVDELTGEKYIYNQNKGNIEYIDPAGKKTVTNVKGGQSNSIKNSTYKELIKDKGALKELNDRFGKDKLKTFLKALKSNPKTSAGVIIGSAILGGSLIEPAEGQTNYLQSASGTSTAKNMLDLTQEFVKGGIQGVGDLVGLGVDAVEHVIDWGGAIVGKNPGLSANKNFIDNFIEKKLTGWDLIESDVDNPNSYWNVAGQGANLAGSVLSIPGVGVVGKGLTKGANLLEAGTKAEKSLSKAGDVLGLANKAGWKTNTAIGVGQVGSGIYENKDGLSEGMNGMIPEPGEDGLYGLRKYATNKISTTPKQEKENYSNRDITKNEDGTYSYISKLDGKEKKFNSLDEAKKDINTGVTGFRNYKDALATDINTSIQSAIKESGITDTKKIKDFKKQQIDKLKGNTELQSKGFKDIDFDNIIG